MRRALFTLLTMPMLGALGVAAAVARVRDQPLRTRLHEGRDPRQLMIVFPGLAANGWMLARFGIVQAIRDGGFEGDVLTADVGLLDFVQRRVASRVDTEVLGPFAGGYDKVRVLGISMGAMTALVTAERFAHELEAVVLLSPWLGPPGTASRIAKAGGIDAWRPPRAPAWHDRVWAWWKRHDGQPRVWVGYGDADGVNGVPTPLLDRLPASRVRVLPGGHAWAVWRQLTTALVAEELREDRVDLPALVEHLDGLLVP